MKFKSLIINSSDKKINKFDLTLNNFPEYFTQFSMTSIKETCPTLQFQ